jgi:HEAT repeat protein
MSPGLPKSSASQSERESRASALRELSRWPDDRAAAEAIAASGGYHQFLIDPVVLNKRDAIAAGTILAAVDVRFIPRLTEAADSFVSAAPLMRALEIIEAAERQNVVIPWLRRLTGHRDARVRSKAVYLMCRANGNPMLTVKHLDSSDPRVRANAVEALWGVTSLPARHTLEFAAKDDHHRVAVNALLGLYRLGVEHAADRLHDLTHHTSPQFRAAAAWAMGQTGDSAFENDLQTLAADTVDAVRTSATAAIQVMADRTKESVA